MKVYRIFFMLALATVIVPAGAKAQDQSQAPAAGQSNGPATPVPPSSTQVPDDSGNRQAPVPTARGLFASGDTSQDAVVAPVEPDTHTLSSIETSGLGDLGGLGHQFDLSLQLSQSVGSGIVSTSQPSAVTSLGGGITFNQRWLKDRLTILYNGGETLIFPGPSSNDQSYNEFSISNSYVSGRWTFRLRNDLSQAPQATFGGLFTGSALSVGQGFSNTLVPTSSSGQSILTAEANRLGNLATGEIDYALSHRAAITFTGAFGLLDFTSPGYVDSHDFNGHVGYNYILDSKDTIGLVYGYDRIFYAGNSGQTETNTFSASYGRKITGKLAFQVSAGPQLITNIGSVGQQWSWSLFTSLLYQFRPTTGFTLGYSHGTTNGSGVFFGAETDTIAGGLNHQFSRTWSGSLNAGYARNANLVPSNVDSNLFQNWFGGGSVGHPIGRHIQVSLSYALQKQVASAGACPVLTCGVPSGLTQIGSVAISWHPLLARPN